MTTNTTIAFSSVEWRDLCIHNAERLAKSLERFDKPTDADVAHIAQELDRMKLFMVAWSRSQKPVEPGYDPIFRVLNARVVTERSIQELTDGFKSNPPPIPRKRGRPRKIPLEVQHQ